jgi:hypothetical protein
VASACRVTFSCVEAVDAGAICISEHYRRGLLRECADNACLPHLHMKTKRALAISGIDVVHFSGL